MKNKKTIPATLQAVSRFTEAFEADLSTLSVEMRTHVVLGLQELLVNVVKHAYSDASGDIDLQWEQSADELALSVRDYAEKKFDHPETVSLPDPLDLPESGMGLFIIYQSFDKVSYKRLTDGNQWQLSKSLGG